MYGERNQDVPWKDSFPVWHVYREYSGRNADGRRDAMNLCIQLPDFLPRLPGAQGSRNEFCRFVKKHDNQTKTRIPSFAAWARIPGRQVQGGCRTFLYAQRWRLILRGPQYCLARIYVRVFVLSFCSTKKSGDEISMISSSPFFCPKETRCLSIPYAQWVRCLHGLRPLLYLGSNDFLADSDFIRIFMSYCVVEFLK